MIKVKGSAVSRWVKSKLWFSLNSDTIKTVAGIVGLFILGTAVMFALMAITTN